LGCAADDFFEVVILAFARAELAEDVLDHDECSSMRSRINGADGERLREFRVREER